MRLCRLINETQLDADVLGRWLDANGAPGDGEEPVLEQLNGGSQNTLYLIQRGGQRMVLRMPGARADAARIDGLLREIRLVRALAGTDVPHAELIAANDAGDLLGMPFYVMQAIDGWSPMDGGWPAPFDDDLERAPRLGVRARRGRRQAGPGGLARARAWTASAVPTDSTNGRSTAGWLSWTATRCATFPASTRPPTGCAATGPRITSRASCTAITSSPTSCSRTVSPARLAAIVDWEMTTVGDPLLDLAWALLGYDGENPSDDGFYLDMKGMPTRSELLEHYEKVSGLSTENIDYYLVLANWKLGIVLEKTYAAGVRTGKVDPKIQDAFGAMIPRLIATAAELARSLPSKGH